MSHRSATARRTLAPGVSVFMSAREKDSCVFGASTAYTVDRTLAGRTGVAITAADFDLDGHPDVALTVGDCMAQPFTDRCPSAAAVVFRGEGNGRFLPDAPFHVFANEESWLPSGITAGDVTGDDVPDVVVADVDADRTVLVRPGNGDGTFADPLAVPVGPRDSGYDYQVGGHPHVVIADLDADGLPDDIGVVSPGPVEPAASSVSVRYGPFA